MASEYFEVSTANIYVYNTNAKLTPDNAYAMISKGLKFQAEPVSSDKHWFKITSCTDYPDLAGKFVYKYVLASGTNFTEVEKNSGSSGSSTVVGTSEAQRDENGNPISYDENGNVITQEGLGEDGGDAEETAQVYVDDTFLSQYVNAMSSSEYYNLLMTGLRVQDLRGILGLPHQFLPITDIRLDGSNDNDALGRVYSEKILKTMPLLLITPGIPTFMAGFSEDQKKTLADQFFNKDENNPELLDLTKEQSGKYYSLKYAYVDYFDYVNGMLRSAAVFLEIHHTKVDGKQLENYNWLYDASSDDKNIWGQTGIGKFLGPYVGSIAIYADCGTTVSDSFSNGTTQSQLSSTLNSLSDTGRELNFLVGNVGSATGLQLNALTGLEDFQNNLPEVQEKIAELLGDNSVMGNILGKATTILAGGRLVFPEIWSDSSFGRSYNCSMRLVSPSGDKLSVYLNILVPIYHLLAMALPRESLQQSYFSPFLLRCYYKGMFNIDMGIMTDLSITKGAEAEWTVEGIPTVAEVQFSIKDLYETMYMSRAKDDRGFGLVSNITELDYIANSCGININDQEVTRAVRLWSVLKLENGVSDTITSGFFGNIMQSFNQKLNDLLGAF